MHPQDTVYLCVFVRIETKSRKACEESSSCNQHIRRLSFFFSMFEAYQPSNWLIRLTFLQVVSFMFAYNYKASYHHGLTRSCHKPVYGAFFPYATIRAAKPWEALLCFSATSVSWTTSGLRAPMRFISFYGFGASLKGAQYCRIIDFLSRK